MDRTAAVEKLRVAASATCLAMGLTACATSVGPGSAGGTLSSTQLPVPSARETSVAPGTISDPALASALDEAARRYWSVQSQVYLEPRANMGLVDTAATGQTATDLRFQAQQIIDKNLRVTGSVAVVRTNIASVMPSPVVSGQLATAVVKTCNDVSAIQIDTADGTSTIDPNRLPQNQASLTLVNADPSASAGWRVSAIDQGPAVPCDSAS